MPTLPEVLDALNESPFEKEGKYVPSCGIHVVLNPSMKVPSKRKGNTPFTASSEGQIYPQ